MKFEESEKKVKSEIPESEMDFDLEKKIQEQDELDSDSDELSNVLGRNPVAALNNQKSEAEIEQPDMTDSDEEEEGEQP